MVSHAIALYLSLIIFVIINKINIDVLQCIIISVLLALGLISGGIPSAVNAADVQDDYIDRSRCEDDSPYVSEDLCDDLIAIRDSQAASAVSCMPQLL